MFVRVVTKNDVLSENTVKAILLANTPLNDEILFEALHRSLPMSDNTLKQLLVESSPLSVFMWMK